MENREIDDPEVWLREHADRLVLFARTWVDCYADAEDVFQEAFVRFWQRRHGVRQQRAYLYQCVKTAALNWRRTVSRRREQAGDDKLLFRLADESSDRQKAFGPNDVSAALDRLPTEQREVVVMKFWGGLTFAEISTALAIPQGTAQSRYRYALTAMRNHIDSSEVSL